MSNLLLALTGLVLVVYIAIFIYPALVPPPLRPPVVPITVTSPPPATASTSSATPTATAAPTDLAPPLPLPSPSLTLEMPTQVVVADTPTPTQTSTRTPTFTQTNTPTVTPTATATPTITPSTYPYTLQASYPRYSAYPGGCQWQGFTGQIFDLNRQPVIGLVVYIGGADYLTLSGAAQEYNLPGWVQKVSDQPANSNGFYSVQLQDPLGNPLSESIALTTTSNCAQNLVTVNFIQNH